MLAKACGLWGVTFSVDGLTLSRDTLSNRRQKSEFVSKPPVQLVLKELESLLETLTPNIKAKSVASNQIEITIRIAV